MPETIAQAAVIPTEVVAKAFLKSMKATLWPNESWNIGKDGHGIEEAAQWIAKLVDEINSIRVMALGSSKMVDEVAVEYRKMREGYR